MSFPLRRVSVSCWCPFHLHLELSDVAILTHMEGWECSLYSGHIRRKKWILGDPWQPQLQKTLSRVIRSNLYFEKIFLANC